MLTKRKDIQALYKQIASQFKDFLLSDKSREFFLFLFFFFVAACFWLLQTLNNDYEADLSISVRLKDVPNEVVVTSEPASKIKVRVKDKGTVLMNYMLGKGFYPLFLNFSETQNNSNHVKVMPEEIKDLVQSQLKASTKLVSVLPDTLEYFYSEGSCKKVPVRLQGSFTAAKRYYLADTLFMPDSVLAYAPEAVLKTVDSAPTKYHVVENISDTLRKEIQLRAPKGVKFVPSVVNYMLPVDVYMEKTIEVPVQGIDFPDNVVLRTFPSKVQVTFQVGMNRFRQMETSDFSVYLSYKDLCTASGDSYPVFLTTQPEDIYNVRLYPSKVDFLLEQNSSEPCLTE